MPTHSTDNLEQIVVRPPNVKELSTEAAAFIGAHPVRVEPQTQVAVLPVVDPITHEDALLVIKECRAREKRIDDLFEPARKALDTAKKEVLALRDTAKRPYEQLRAAADRGCLAFETEQRRIAAEAQARLEEAARKDEEERRLLDAAEAEEAGDAQAAAEILAEPVVAPVIPVAPQVARVEGVSTATRYRAEVVDLHALVRHVAANPHLVNLLLPNGPALNAQARSLREAMQIPGVKVVKETDRRVRG
jgi:hypothetical protein